MVAAERNDCGVHIVALRELGRELGIEPEMLSEVSTRCNAASSNSRTASAAWRSCALRISHDMLRGALRKIFA